MTKKKSELEQALSDFRKTQKEQRSIIAVYERIIRMKEREIRDIENKMESLKAEYEAKCEEIFGTNMECYIQGVRFEQHVAWWIRKHFPQYSFRLWQGDKYYKPYEDEEPITAEWNSFPDLIFIDVKAKKALAIECKFRTSGFLTIDHDHYMNYKRAETQISKYFGVKTEVFVMAGTNEYEGDSQRPDYMYCIPIDFFKDEEEKDLKSFKEYLVMDRCAYATKPILDNIHF